MELLNFIKQHKDWEELIQRHPFNIKVTKSDGYTLLKYNQVASDFNERIVRECRGIILDSTCNVVCYPFNKFFNYCEPHADEIDWSTARVQEKIDGSIMKLWYHNGWHLSTNGTINAYTTPLNGESNMSGIRTFGDLFDNAVNRSDLIVERLNRDYTYMFELVSPLKRIVIPYAETKIYHIGTRNNKTFEEVNMDIGVQKPKEFPIHNISDAILYSMEKMGDDEEGFVVVDANWHRVKIKNPTYLMLHRTVNNNIVSDGYILELLLANEQDEFLSYFTQYQERFDNIQQRLTNYINSIKLNWEKIKPFEDLDRPAFAKKVSEIDRQNSWVYFRWYENKKFADEDIMDYIMTYIRNKPIKNLLKIVEEGE